ncbi:MAG TPA: hypothetical protein VGK74_28460 [Symbiobacteriaceae bacterium]|jgi:hypothetical protein
MIERWFGPRLVVAITILGTVGERVVRFNGEVRLRGPADVGRALKAAGAAAGVDLLQALADGAQPALLLDGRRLSLPEELAAPVAQGSRLSWLMPMAGGSSRFC